MAAEYQFHGIVDLRATVTDSLASSYLAGGQGKFGLNNGEQLSLGQAGALISVDWENGLSAHSVLNAYINSESGNDNVLGLTEGFLKYRTVPNDDGYRLQIRAGIFYPEISLENHAFAWASQNTLNSSFINTWIGEEIRVLGSEFKLTRLGRINNNKFDLSLSGSVFANNDPAGALLAWHGWTMSSRQTLWTEKRPITWFPARAMGDVLSEQAADSDPFFELDGRLGYHLRSEWSLHNKGSISVGYYDNNAVPYEVEKGQYGWRTQFYHLGIQWRLSSALSLTSQYMIGSTLMQSAPGVDVVNNDYESVFTALTYRWHQLLGTKKHQSTIRLEYFSVDDKDDTVGDNNNEHGHALTLNHTYRFSKHWFLACEYNVIDSYRPARVYENQSVDLVEQQLQLAARYFF